LFVRVSMAPGIEERGSGIGWGSGAVTITGGSWMMGGGFEVGSPLCVAEPGGGDWARAVVTSPVP
jgi:hypothetical protein